MGSLPPAKVSYSAVVAASRRHNEQSGTMIKANGGDLPTTASNPREKKPLMPIALPRVKPSKHLMPVALPKFLASKSSTSGTSKYKIDEAHVGNKTIERFQPGELDELINSMALKSDNNPYQRLDLASQQIRLLQILPGESSSEIECQFKSVYLNQKPRYTALSYTWGPPPADCYITVNRRRMAVRKNLWSFLQQVRMMGISDPFWIDAICINQVDGLERTHQVTLMSKIYGQAAQVYVWLGPSEGKGELAIEVLQNVRSYFEDRQTFHQLWTDPGGFALTWFCQQPYWTRLWIFQEIMLASEVMLMCGHNLVRWQALEDLLLQTSIAWPHKHKDNVPSNALAVLQSAANSLAVQIRRRFDRSSLLVLMEATSHLECAETRDKAYALLALARLDRDQINPDYDVPVLSLAHVILRSEYKHKKPSSMDEVLQKCRRLECLLGLEENAMYELGGPHGLTPLPPKTIVEAFPFKAVGASVTLWWALFHGHQVVERFLLDRTLSWRLRQALGSAAIMNDTALQILITAHSLTPWFWYQDVACRALTEDQPRAPQIVRTLVEATKIGLRHGGEENKRVAVATIVGNDGTYMLEFSKAYTTTWSVEYKTLYCPWDINSACADLFQETIGPVQPYALSSALAVRRTDIEARNYLGDTTLANAVLPTGYQIGTHDVSQNRLEAVRRLISQGANVNARNYLGRTPLMNMVLYNVNDGNGLWTWNETIRKRLGNPADTPLDKDRFHTVEPAHLEIMQLLIASGADINARDLSHQTALCLAASNANLEAVLILLPHIPYPAEDDQLYEAIGNVTTTRRMLLKCPRDPMTKLLTSRYNQVKKKLNWHMD